MAREDGHRLREMARQALSEVDAVFNGVSTGTADRMCAEILAARHIACYGVGRAPLLPIPSDEERDWDWA